MNDFLFWPNISELDIKNAVLSDRIRLVEKFHTGINKVILNIFLTKNNILTFLGHKRSRMRLFCSYW